MDTKAVEITVECIVDAPVEKVWRCFTNPSDITCWNFASDTWACPRAESDLCAGGKFSYRMEARDGSFGFDFGGAFDVVTPNELLAYTIGDGRKVTVRFSAIEGGRTKVVEVFEAEQTHPADMQKGGWQSILDNFKKYTEAQ